MFKTNTKRTEFCNEVTNLIDLQRLEAAKAAVETTDAANTRVTVQRKHDAAGMTAALAIECISEIGRAHV
jgi:hypothetical protein